MKAVSIRTRNLCRSAAWTILWIIQISWKPVSPSFLRCRAIPASYSLALQRIRKLQEQAAIPDDLVASFQPAGNLRLPIHTLPERHRTSAKLVRGNGGVNKRLVLGVAQNCGIGKRYGMGNRAGIYTRYNVHVFLKFFARIVGLDACLQRPRARIQRSCHVRNAPVEYFRISISLNRDRISDPYVWQILLVDIDQHPDGADVGNHEALRGPRLDELSRGYILLNHQAANRSLYWNLK